MSVSRLGIVLLSLSLIPHSLIAQVSYQLEDINPVTTPVSNPLEEPRLAVNYQGLTWFAFDDGIHGQELWQTDGTVAGTRLAVDTVSGKWSNLTRYLLEYNGMLYNFGTSVYRSNGTYSSNERFVNQYVYNPQVIGAYLYWIAGGQLWRTDGTEAGTIQLANEVDQYFELAGNVISINDNEVMTSDGTVAGTTTIASATIQTNSAAMFDSKLYFIVRAVDNQWQLWHSDGTVGGTSALYTLPSQGNDSPDDFSVVDSLFFFRTETARLWRSDGTAEGTYSLDLPAGYIYSDTLGTFAEQLVFLAFNTSGNYEVWISDGTPENTRSLGELSGLGPVFTREVLGEFDGHFYFTGYLNSSAYLLRTNGTTMEVIKTWDANEAPIVEPEKRTIETRATTFTAAGKLFFPMDDGIHGREWWTTDGTEANTQLFAELANDASGSLGLDFAGTVLPLGERILFQAFCYPHVALWSTDGSSAGTKQLASVSNEMYLYQGSLYYDNNDALWRGDGTVEGGRQISSLRAKYFHEHANQLRFVNSNSIWSLGDADVPAQVRGPFTGDEYINTPITSAGDHYYLFSWVNHGFSADYSLWRATDTTAELLQQWPETSVYPRRFIEPLGDGVLVGMKNELYFATNETIERIDDGSLTWIGEPIAYAGKYYFPAITAAHGHELWSSDGTAIGTTRITDLNPGSGDGLTSSQIIEYKGLLYFSGHNGVREYIVRSDGSAPGTITFTELYPAHYTSKAFAEVGGNLYLAALTEATGFEVWRTDGSEAGTTLAIELAEGTADTLPNQLWPLGDQLFFVADTGLGHEPQIYREQPATTIQTQTEVCDTSDPLTATVLEDHPDTNYTWSLTGGTLQSGQGTQTITFTGTAPTVEISIDLDVDGVTAMANETVTRQSTAPAPPAAINGQVNFCPGEAGQLYAVDSPIEGLTYQWRVPTGATITSGQGTAEITVDFGAFGGEIAVAAVNGCDASTETTLDLELFDAPLANAGPSQVVCDTQTSLNGNSSTEATGTWAIISGEGGIFTDPNDPTTLFEGNPGETYVLEWTLDHPICGGDSDRTTIAFAPPTDIADAGPDQTICAASTLLEANSSDTGYGTWELLSGEGGSFENRYDPETRFYGAAGTTYVARWILRSKPCPETRDEVTLSFLPRPSIDAGTAAAIIDGESHTLSASPAGGTWSIEAGPETSIAQIDDPSAADTIITPIGGPGNYRLRWTVPRVDCEDLVAELELNVKPVRLLAHDAGSLPGESGTGTYTPRAGIYWQGHYYFTANTHGRELWRTDGVAVEQVSDLTRVNNGGYPAAYNPLEDTLVFTAIDGLGNREVWATTGSGAEQLTTTGGYPNNLVKVGNQVYFHYSAQLWVTDGTRGGTQLVHEDSLTPRGTYDGKLIYTNGSHTWVGLGTEHDAYLGNFSQLTSVTYHDSLVFLTDGLWQSHGTSLGTQQITASPTSVTNGEMIVFGDHIFFAASGNSSGNELWRSDATAEGTFQLKEINSNGHANPRLLTAGEQTLYFAARDNDGEGLWASDGSSVNTRKIDQGTILDIEVRGDTAYYLVDEGFRTSYRRATASGSEEIYLLNDDISLMGWDFGAHLLGLEYDANGQGLWFSDGTHEGTRPFAQVKQPAALGFTNAITFQNKLYFSHLDEAYGYETWVTDANGPRLLADLEPGTSGSGTIQEHQIIGDTMYFVTNSPLRMWRSDGTAEGTEVLIDRNTDTRSISNLVTLGDQLYFLWDTRSGRKLYRSDGTPEGTVVLDPDGLSYIDNMVVWRDKLYFIGVANSQRSLYESDGTLAGTQPTPIYSETLTEWAPYPTPTHLYFKIDDDLYLSETGEPATVIFDADDTEGKVVGNRLLLHKTSISTKAIIAFEGAEPTTLIDLTGITANTFHWTIGTSKALILAVQNDRARAWFSDGTLAGTVVQDMDTRLIHPWIGDPLSLGDRFFLTMHDPNTGSELWEIDETDHWLFMESQVGPAWQTIQQMAADDDQLWLQIGAPGGRRFSVIHKQKLEIADPRLETALEERYDQNGDGQIDAFEADTIVQLDLSNLGLYDLDGIQALTNLQQVDLHGNQLTDIEPLRHTSLGSGSNDFLDLTDNFLTEENCSDIALLLTRAQSSGATVHYAEQGGDRYYPPPPKWPAASIVDMIGGNEIPANQLDCQPARVMHIEMVGGAQ